MASVAEKNILLCHKTLKNNLQSVDGSFLTYTQ